jgi:hypothetical protein
MTIFLISYAVFLAVFKTITVIICWGLNKKLDILLVLDAIFVILLMIYHIISIAE